MLLSKLNKSSLVLTAILIMHIILFKEDIYSQSFTIDQTISDGAQGMTIAFDGLAFFTGNLGADSFFPPGKVADFWGFQYLRDNDPSEMGHNTDFLTNASFNMLSILDTNQFNKLKVLAKMQIDNINNYGYARFVLIKAFRRLLTGDVPIGATGLNLDAVKNYSADMYKLDGRISYERARVMGAILASLSSTQKAYLEALKGKGMLTWPLLTEPESLKGLSKDEKIAVMTYGGDLFSWYLGSVDADVYFCPERQGTYFGSFYLKDAPAVGNPGYSIGTNITADYGNLFLNSLSTTDAVLSTSPSYTFTISGNKDLLANFTKIQYSVITSTNPNNTGTVSGFGSYNLGSSVTLTATPANGYTFLNWTENGVVLSTNSSYTFIIAGKRALVANFTRIQFTLTTSSNPDNGGTVAGSGNYNSGSSVILVATPANGFAFLNWTENGSIISTNGTYTFNINGNRTLIANFKRLQFTVNISCNPVNGGNVSGSGIFDFESAVTISAIPNNGFRFKNWTEEVVEISKNAQYEFSLTKNRNLIANFVNITAIEKVEEIPLGYSLEQNYPNPFNPSTKIQFSIPEDLMVRLSVYNILGQEVMRLIDNQLTAGELPDGIYFYKIQAGEFSQTKKMILTK